MPASAQTEDVVTWAYGAFLGTGWYQLDDDHRVYNLRLPPRWRYRETDPEAVGADRWGIEFQFPVTLGLYRLNEPGAFLDVENVGTFSFTPGVEVEIPLTPKWYLRGYGHVGWGTETGNETSAWIADAGIRSRYRIRYGRPRIDLVNEVFVAGYTPSEGASDQLSGLMAGLEFAHPIGLRSGSGKPLQIKWEVAYRYFGSDLAFTTIDRERIRIGSEWEVGFAFAPRDGPVRLGRLELEHIGLAYQFSAGGDFEAVTLNLSSHFTR